ncbi:MAG: acyltransferase, partial [Bdellovibrionales bacterium]|nr:acyltransferase [Bdellovibrionales bacterium]
MIVFIFKRYCQYYSKLLNHFLFFKKFNILAPASCAIYGVEGISIKNNFSLGENCELYARKSPSLGAKIKIGSNVALNSNVIINAECGGSIEIGDNVIIGPATMMRASNHNFRQSGVLIRNQGHSHGKIVIESNVWIGANVTILPNVTIGKNSVIAAGSIIIKD